MSFTVKSEIYINDAGEVESLARKSMQTTRLSQSGMSFLHTPQRPRIDISRLAGNASEVSNTFKGKSVRGIYQADETIPRLAAVSANRKNNQNNSIFVNKFAHSDQRGVYVSSKPAVTSSVRYSK